MSKLPSWARVPKHKEKVIPTNKGWVVERTGELLRSVKNLLVRLEDYPEVLETFFEVEEKLVENELDSIDVEDTETGLEDLDTVVEEPQEDVQLKDEIDQELETEAKPKKVSKLRTFKHPETGEEVQAKNTNNKTLKAWAKELGVEAKDLEVK